MSALLLGLSLGLGAGLSPGPLFALVIRTAVRDGLRAGCLVALSPLLTDVPIILIALITAQTAPASVLAPLALVGGLFVVWLGIDALREAPPSPAGETTIEAAGTAGADGATAIAGLDRGADGRRAILWGAATNALSPHPWVFWLSVGAPLLARSSVSEAALFLAGFYVSLLGSKVAIAAAIVAGRDRLLHGRGYLMLLKATGLLLLLTGALLISDGLHRLTAVW